MKNKELGAVKQAIHMMKFESFGEIKQAGNTVDEIDNAMQAWAVKEGEVFKEHGIEPVNGQYGIDPKDERYGAIGEQMKKLSDEETGIEVAFMSEEQFNNAIKVREPIPTELLIVASKYLVK